MTYLDVQTPTRKTSQAILAGFALFIAGAVSVAGLHIFGFRIGFGFIPLLVLVIWPRQANTIVSLAFVFFAGLFTDWAIGGIIGQSSLIFVLIWGFFRPETRSDPFSPFGFCLIWIATCGLALIILSLSGYFVLGILPDFPTLGRQMILASILLPVFMLFRRSLSTRFNDREEWG